VYVINKNGMLVIVLIYVDDLMVASNDERTLTAIKSELAGMSDIKDMGFLKYCLGIEFEQNLEKHEIKKCTSSVMQMRSSNGLAWKTPIQCQHHWPKMRNYQ